ncbi:glycoside hydrolase family 92 protein [Hygrophoropsis aurantiaca]|uniref:Glycoside hydrolase family 92 protein n=1 Tax=Hygrophoropsis aurantiaca TaxID=72124 RepID=A0ACB8AQN4_9AGAM|nr:glycoside hydrolase family 92 protein [Hygrophoropsis aurantiaca]
MSLRSTGRLLLLASILGSTVAKSVPLEFRYPPSQAVDYVNPLIGNGGSMADKGNDTPDGKSGGMIPSTAPPFAMTRWVAQTRQNYVSLTPYYWSETTIHGFQGTHQPAIWMGESGQVVVSPGAGQVQPTFETRGMNFSKDNEIATASYYSVEMNAKEGGTILAEQSATSRVGHLRFSYTNTKTPYVLIEATRASILGAHNTSNVTYPLGTVFIDPNRREITGSNPERQDIIIAPLSTPATKWSGYFCARFDQDFSAWGIVQSGTLYPGQTSGTGKSLSGYASFGDHVTKVNVRVGVSFISIDQARENLDREISDHDRLEDTARKTRVEWAEKLDRIKVIGGTDEDKETFYTGFFHTMQYPSEASEYGKYYSGYDDSVHEGISYTGYSIWDTYRAEWAWLIMFAPERIAGMVQSMVQDYKEGGWLPMWKNIIETNIMVGTHADSLVAEAALKGITGFDRDTAWEAVYKDATVPPVNDKTVVYGDRQQGVDYEVRAGLSSTYTQNGWVADDVHSESASRTLDYSYDDYAVSVLASVLKKDTEAAFFRNRSLTSPFTIFNNATGFMEARKANGAWAGPTRGFTEGDKWAYTFDVVHDIPGLIARKGGNASFVTFLDQHFDGGHNDHTNEPSHHIPYLYTLAGAASKSQSRIREIAKANYNNSVNGLSGNEDCGQTSAWYLFSALGFYPVNPVSGEYVVGSPFFDIVHVDFPNGKNLNILASGATVNQYVRSLSVNGHQIENPILTHDQILNGGLFQFDMSGAPQKWGSSTLATS